MFDKPTIEPEPFAAADCGCCIASHEKGAKKGCALIRAAPQPLCEIIEMSDSAPV